MLVELRRVFADDLVPALVQGDLAGGDVEPVLLNRLRADVLGASASIGRAPGSKTALMANAAAELANIRTLTGGARALIAKSETLEQAITYLFGDKAFKEYLRGEFHGTKQLPQLNQLLSAVPLLAEPERPRPSDHLKAAKFDGEKALSQLRALDDEALRAFLKQVQEQVIPERVVTLFRERDWVELGKFSELFVSKSPGLQKTLSHVGRANIYNGDLDAAVKLLSIASDLFPGDAEIVNYRGVALARQGDFTTAEAALRRARELQPKSVRFKRELGNILRMGSRRAPTEKGRQAAAAEAVVLLTEALEEDYNAGAARTLARFLHDIGQFDRCVPIIDRVIAENEEDVEALVLKSRAFVSLNRVSEALEIAARVQELDPANQTAAFLIRAMRFLAEGGEAAKPATFGDVLYGPDGVVAAGPFGSPAAVAPGNTLVQQLRALPFDWIRLTPAAEGAPAGSVDISALRDAVDPAAGFHVEPPEGSQPLRLWRRDAVLGLHDSGMIGSDLAGLEAFERFYVRGAQPTSEGAVAVVMSRHGSFKFGGGEFFIESMAEHYSTIGYRPLIVGTRQDYRGQSGVGANGFRFDFVEDSPAALRRLFLTEDARLVHAISGLGFAVAEALSYSNIPFIYGVHFWREALGTDTDDYYFDAAGEPLARPEFNYVLSRAATVYANSEFTRDVLERAYGVRCPVVFSVPKEGEKA